jgi:hypothetical protein
MKRFAITITMLVAAPALADKAAPPEKPGTIDCAKQPETTINDPGGKYTFTGACKKITVNGASNKLKIESVDALSVTGAQNHLEVGAAEKITVSGAMNTLTYKSGLGGKGAPKVDSTGVGNKISQTK